MKKLLFFTLCFFLWKNCFLLSEDQPRWQLATTENEGNLYDLNSLEEAKISLKKALEDILFLPSQDSLVLLIHGRGKHPKKLYGKVGLKRTNIIETLQKEYKVKVIVFHWWPSYKNPINFRVPEKGARNSAQAFSFLLQALAEYKEKRPYANTTLITHSMGSIVLESYLQSSPSAPLSSLFQNIILSAPASASKGHQKWLEKISMKNRLYVTFSAKDNILSSAALLVGTRLGQKLKDYPLAKNAVYIDVSPLTKNRHQYYIKSKGNLFSFFDKVLRGETVLLEEKEGFKKKKHDGKTSSNVFFMVD